MKFTTAQRVAKLREAIAMLIDVDALQQDGLGSCVACDEIHDEITNIIDTLKEGVEEFEGVE
jgi:hypothetical protein